MRKVSPIQEEFINMVDGQTDLDTILAGEPEPIATGFQFTEGPVWHPDGYLLFSDIPGHRIMKWTPDGQTLKQELCRRLNKSFL